MFVPDYLIYDEYKKREENRREDGLQPLHLPLYQPDVDPTWPHRDDESQDDESERGVIIIDMNTGMEIAD